MKNPLDAPLINADFGAAGGTAADGSAMSGAAEVVRPAWTAQLRAILRKTMRAKSRQRLSMLGEIFMPIQMIAWIFLMKMNLPDFSYPAVQFSAFNVTDYSPFLCTSTPGATRRSASARASTALVGGASSWASPRTRRASRR